MEIVVTVPSRSNHVLNWTDDVVVDENEPPHQPIILAAGAEITITFTPATNAPTTAITVNVMYHGDDDEASPINLYTETFSIDQSSETKTFQLPTINSHSVFIQVESTPNNRPSSVKNTINFITLSSCFIEPAADQD